VDLPDLVYYEEDVLENEKPRCRLERIPLDLSDAAARHSLLGELNSRAMKIVVPTDAPATKQAEETTARVRSDAVRLERETGAEVVVGGKRVEGKGYFIQPTVLAQTNRDMRVVREEIFGPVVCAMPIDDDDLDRIVKLANDTDYGLSSSIWTRDISLAHKLARRIKAGTVRVNGGRGLDYALPFGGYKQSGWGRENAREGVEAYTEIKSVSVAL